MRELAYCRTRIDVLVQELESPLANLPVSEDTPAVLSEEVLQQTLHPTNTLNVVLPAGETHIERSAKKVANAVKPQDVPRLEVALQKLVLEPRGGLTALCLLNADMSRTLVAPMVEQTTAFLSDLLPVTDVTEVEVSTLRGRWSWRCASRTTTSGRRRRAGRGRTATRSCWCRKRTPVSRSPRW